jgi:mono/diheme cytochrome c family protein
MRPHWVAAAFLLTALLLACPGSGNDDGPTSDAAAATPESGSDGGSPVSPVSGPSWLAHLGLEVSETRLGQMGGSRPQPGERGEEPDLATPLEGQGGGMRSALRRALSAFGRGEDSEALVDERFRLTGADLYRLSCRSCHGPAGEGAPPEIASLLDPVRATSPDAIKARMEARGTPIDEEMAAELASQAEEMLRTRLREGGEKMPSFEHLQGDEVEALLGYLQELAGGGSPGRSGVLVSQSAARVGEHLVKGTCHVCHDATGPGGHHQTMMRGIIPSLESFPEEYSLDSVLYKVERGSSGMMGMMGMMRQDRKMPAFPYLSQEEVAAGYLYLKVYPPRPR